MTNKVFSDSKTIAQALSDSRKARLDMEISGLRLEEAIAALEADIRERRKYYLHVIYRTKP
jgi:hypothetical protein